MNASVQLISRFRSLQHQDQFSVEVVSAVCGLVFVLCFVRFDVGRVCGACGLGLHVQAKAGASATVKCEQSRSNGCRAQRKTAVCLLSGSCGTHGQRFDSNFYLCSSDEGSLRTPWRRTKTCGYLVRSGVTRIRTTPFVQRWVCSSSYALRV